MNVIRLLAFLMVILCSIASGSVPRHRKVRQIRPQDVVTVSEEDMENMSPERLAELNRMYTHEFFKPLK